MEPKTVDPVTLDYDVFDCPANRKTERNLPPIILIHGYLWNRSMYYHLARCLQSRTGRRVYTVDIRSHGTSPRAPFENVQDTVPDLKKFLIDRKITKASFVCHSFSACVAHILALEQPESVEKIVMVDHMPDQVDYEKVAVPYTRYQVNAQNRILRLLDPSLSLLKAKEFLLIKAATALPSSNIAKTVTKIKGENPPNMVCTYGGRIFTRLEEVKYEIQTVILRKGASDLAKENGKFKWNTDIDELVHSLENIENYYRQPKTVYNGQILIIRAEGSKLVEDEQVAESQKWNPNLRVVTFKGGSHMLMFEMEKQFVEEVARFLNS